MGGPLPNAGNERQAAAAAARVSEAASAGLLSWGQGAVDLDGTFSSEIAARPPRCRRVLAPVPKRREMYDFGMIRQRRGRPREKRPYLPVLTGRGTTGGLVVEGRASSAVVASMINAGRALCATPIGRVERRTRRRRRS